ncbi:unnamed protein product, partial [Nippostrongylus brasiliensis]
DGGSLLRELHRRRLIELTKQLQDNVTVEVRGRIYEFRDLCEPYCDMNTAFLAFLKLYDPETPSTHTYPQVEIFGTKAFIGNNAYGVTLRNGTKQIAAFSTAILPIYLVSSYENTDVIYRWLLAARESFADERFAIFKFANYAADYGAVPSFASAVAPIFLVAIVLHLVVVKHQEKGKRRREQFFSC